MAQEKGKTGARASLDLFTRAGARRKANQFPFSKVTESTKSEFLVFSELAMARSDGPWRSRTAPGPAGYEKPVITNRQLQITALKFKWL